MTPFGAPEVAAKFSSYPANVRTDLLSLRELVFTVARSSPLVGELEEALKWGEPAFVTKNKSGSTIRIDWKSKTPDEYAMYFNCKTTLVDTFRTLFPEEFVFAGNRALVFAVGARPPQDSLSFCILAALTYRLKRSAPTPSRA